MLVLLFGLFSLVNFLLEPAVLGLELVEFGVLQPCFDVECERQVGEDILVQRLVIIFHIEVERLFIIDVKIVLDFIIKFPLGQRGHQFLGRYGLGLDHLLRISLLLVRPALWCRV